MHFHQQLTLWLKADPLRCQALRQAAALGLPDWCIAAGFVRNLVWDRLHGFTKPTPLTDIDLIYFNKEDISEEADRALEQRLMQDADLPWSVKNQARMHVRNGDVPYLNTLDAMSCWPESETAVGVRLEPDLAFISPFPLENLRDLQITLNPKRPKIADFEARVAEKKWLEIWPKLQVSRGGMMNRLLIIRHARAGDAEEAAVLLGQLGYPNDADFARQKIARLHGPQDAVLVADLAGQVVGLLGLHLIPTLHDAGFLGKVTALVVLETCRGQGIGCALLAEAERFAAAAGALRMEVLSGNHRTEAHQFYRAAGYSGSDHSRFVRALGPGK